MAEAETTTTEAVETTAATGDQATSSVGETKPPIVGAGGDPTQTQVAPADWPTDWRNKAAAGDEKKMQRLARYQSPQALADALFAAQNRIAAGELKPSLDANAKPEEIAAYRDAHGIPDAPEKYDLTGLDIDAAEKPMIDKFLTSAHGAHMTPEQVKTALKAYQEISEGAQNTRANQDNEIRKNAEDALRAEWGTEYRGNINLLTNMLPEGIKEKLLFGRLSDGTPIGSSVEVLKFLVDIARERNPLGILTPSGETVPGSNALSEYLEMKKLVGTSEFRRDNMKQQRYQMLLDSLLKGGLIDANGNVKSAA